MSLELLLLALLSAALFALALVLTRFGLATRSPLEGASISIPTTSLLLIGLAALTVDLSHWNSKAAVLFALAGIFFPVAVTLLTFVGNYRLGPTLTGTLGNLTPLFAVGLAVVLVGELPTPMQWLGIGVIAAGVGGIFLDSSSTSRVWPLWALSLPVGAALLRGLAQPLVKLGLEFWPDPLVAATIGYFISTIVIFLVKFARSTNTVQISSSGGWWFVVVGLCNGGAVLALYAALAHGPVTLVAPLVATYPVAVLVLERIIPGHVVELKFAALISIAAVVGGVIILVAFR